MKNILSFFTNIYNNVYQFVSRAYDSSKLKVVNDSLVSSALKAASKSCICGFLSSEPKTNSVYKNSFISKILCAVFGFFKHSLSGVKNLLNKSLIIKGCAFFAENIMNIPLNLFGIFLLFFACPGVVLLIFEKADLISTIVNISCLCLGVYLSLNRASFNKSLYTSGIIRFIVTFFSKDGKGIEFFNKTSVSFDKKVFIASGFAGLLLGISGLFISPVMVIGAIVAFIGLTLVMNNFATGVYFAILCFPFLPTMAVVGILLLSMFSFVIKALFDDSFVFVKTGLDLYIVLFAIIIAISGVTSFDKSTSINIALVYIVFILSYFLFTNALKTKNNFITAIMMLLGGGIVVSLIGIYQYIFGFAGGNVWIDSNMFTEIETRVVSTFENPNVLGEYLLIIIPIAIACFFESGTLRNKWSSVFAAGILILCMVFTFSRGCWIGMIISFGILSLFYDRRFIWAGIILLLFSPLYLPESIIQRFMSVGNTTDTSTSYRVYIWLGTIDMLKDYWLTGIGLGEGAFNVIYPHYSYSAIVAPHSHNLFLQILVENGITGFVLFAVMVIVFYKNAIHAICKAHRGFNKASLLALVSAVTGYLVQGLFDNVWYNYRVFMFFFMTLAITMQCANISAADNPESRGETDD